MKKLIEEMKWFLKHTQYVVALALTAVCGYGFAITHPSIGIDDTAVALYLEDGLEVVMGRWTVYLLNKLFSMSEFSPFMLELVGVLLLCLAATLFCVLLKRILGERIDIWGYTIFSCIFVSNPIISEVYIYYYHDGVDVGYVLTALSLLCFLDGMEALEQAKRRRAVGCYLGSMLLIFTAAGCYESLLILYILGLLVILFLRGLCGRDSLKSSHVIGQLAIGALLTVGAVLLRMGMIPCLVRIFGMEDLVGFQRQRSILEMLGLLQNDNAFDLFLMLLKRFWVVYYVNAFVYLPVTGYVIAMVIFGCYAFVLAVRRKNLWYPVLLLGMALTPFLLTLAEVSVTHYRSCQYLPFYTAVGFLLLYLYAASRKRISWLRYLCLFAALILVYRQTQGLNRDFYIDYSKYENTKEILTEIALEVENRYGNDNPVVFTGHYDTPQCLVEDYYVPYSSWQYQWIARITDLVDVHLKEKYFTPYGYCFIGEADFPFIQWGFDAFDGTNREMMNFLERHGHSFPMITEKAVLEKAKEIGDTMPRWPEEGSVTMQDGYILVHI